MIKCTRRIEFDAAHRILKHESKCKMLHGHRYALEITFTSKELDNLGRVVDFGIIKDILGAWIDKNWDHNTVLNKDDSELGSNISKITDQEIYYLDCNPTAENMAKYLFNIICPKLFHDHDISIDRIKLYETPNCSVEIASDSI
ncbi:MAG: 6-pyruvoyltetrahydropterin/6-carboxytetrahydropterin synthase [Rickettsiales bacterium]|jgi:6-pyruvoyltetrahydropterin/6-carboxytetrahydropterin synthase